MIEETYSIFVENTKIADGLSLYYAMLFAKSVLQEFFNEPTMSVTIQKNKMLEE